MAGESEVYIQRLTQIFNGTLSVVSRAYDPSTALNTYYQSDFRLKTDALSYLRALYLKQVNASLDISDPAVFRVVVLQTTADRAASSFAFQLLGTAGASNFQ